MEENNVLIDEMYSKDFIPFENRRVHKKFEPLIRIISKSSADYADVLRKEMYLHESEECSCFYTCKCCLVGGFVEKGESVYELNKKIDRLAERNQLHRYKGFTIPVYKSENDDDLPEYLFHTIGGARSCYAGMYRTIKDNVKFLYRIVGEETVDKQKLYDILCEDNDDSITPYSVACAIGLEEEEYIQM